MDKDATMTLDASPGDILLLSGNGKTRQLNLGYQSVVRDTSARYTHVALVLTPYRIIHAVPGEGVEIRAWCEVRDRYDIHESSVARLQSLEERCREMLTLRAGYYFGQRYSVLALHNPTESFKNQQGIVCSQFVAQVFHDSGFICAESGARNCLPADIDVYTQESADWLRIPLCNYQFDPPLKSGEDLFRQSRDMSFEMDGFASRMMKEAYIISNATSAMETALESMAMAVKAGLITPADVLKNHEWTGDAMSPGSLVTAWKRHFATPKSPAVFMHEEEQRGQMKRLFIESCYAIGNVARQTFDQMGKMTQLFDGWIAATREGGSDVQLYEVYQQLIVLHSNVRLRVFHLDRILSWREEFSDDFNLDISAVYDTGIFECVEDVSRAGECLQAIADWTSARNVWRQMRASTMAMVDELPLIEGATVA